MKTQEYLLIALVGFVIFNNSGLKDYIPSITESQQTISQSDTTDELQKVKQEYNKIESESDRLLIYKLFSGASEYLSVAKSLESTNQFDPILGKVQTSYGWNREKYPDFTTAVSDYLVSVKYDEPKPLSSDEDRKKFAEIFKDLSEAIK